MLGCPQSHCEMVEEGSQEEKKGEEWKGGWWAGSGSPTLLISREEREVPELYISTWPSRLLWRHICQGGRTVQMLFTGFIFNSLLNIETIAMWAFLLIPALQWALRQLRERSLQRRHASSRPKSSVGAGTGQKEISLEMCRTPGKEVQWGVTQHLGYI